jgi:GEVED domain
MKRISLLTLCLALIAVSGVAQYCTSTSQYTNCNNIEEYISNVTIGSLNHNSACLSAPAYEDYTGVGAPTLTQASGTPISVTVSEWYSTTDTVTVFCDWNGNFILNEAGEVFPLLQGTGNSGGNTLYTGTITPPAGAVAQTRMRVKTVWGSSANPCGLNGYSNVEDYTINTSPPTGLVAAGNAAPSPATALTPVVFTVAVTATSPPNPPIGVYAQIDLSPIGGSSTQQMYDDGSTGGDVTGGDNVFTWTQAPAANGVFQLPYNAIDSFARTASGAVTMSVTPSNDGCGSSTTVALGTNGPFTNIFATESGIIPSCGIGYKDVWFNFTPPCTGPYTIDTCTPQQFDTVLAIYASCGGSEIACNDDGGTGCGYTSSIQGVALTAGVPIWIRVASYSSTSTGIFNLNVNQDFIATWSSPFGPGSLQFNLSGGPLGGAYFHAIVLTPGAFPNGWLYGIDITFPEIVNELTIGYPFVGVLNPCGATQFGPIFAVPPGLTIYSVGIGSPGPTLTLPTATTAPVSYTTP